uniref:Uncharacterized protein n=1 Tax=Lepeophtheirus salmonis TaxID=72036 RepID=A0A0K2TL71_LEPSM
MGKCRMNLLRKVAIIMVNFSMSRVTPCNLKMASVRVNHVSNRQIEEVAHPLSSS